MSNEIIFNGVAYVPKDTKELEQNSDLFIGKYVIVRCHDAGVHAGVLMSYEGRSCILKDARRLWYWKPDNNKAFLSGIATDGLDKESKIGVTVPYIMLTEDCEIICCTEKAEKSIRSIKDYEPS